MSRSPTASCSRSARAGQQREALVTQCYKFVLALRGAWSRSVAVAGCGGGGEDAPTEVVLVTHDSFAISKDVKAAFEEESGLTLRILQGGDANEALNRALLTAGDPQGDVHLRDRRQPSSPARSTATCSTSTAPTSSTRSIGTYAAPTTEVTPIDHGEVCLNVDRALVRERGVAPPTTLEELDAAALPGPARRREPRDLLARARVPARDRRRGSGRTAGRSTGASFARTASSSSTAGRRRTRSSSRAPPAAPASGRSSSRTRRAPPPR